MSYLVWNCIICHIERVSPLVQSIITDKFCFCCFTKFTDNFCWKNERSFCIIPKASHIFSIKNVDVFHILKLEILTNNVVSFEHGCWLTETAVQCDLVFVSPVSCRSKTGSLASALWE